MGILIDFKVDFICTFQNLMKERHLVHVFPTRLEHRFHLAPDSYYGKRATFNNSFNNYVFLNMYTDQVVDTLTFSALFLC